MAKIKKTKVDGALVYPATIFPAVKDPNTGQTLTDKLSELGSEASKIDNRTINVKPVNLFEWGRLNALGFSSTNPNYSINELGHITVKGTCLLDIPITHLRGKKVFFGYKGKSDNREYGTFYSNGTELNGIAPEFKTLKIDEDGLIYVALSHPSVDNVVPLNATHLRLQLRNNVELVEIYAGETPYAEDTVYMNDNTTPMPYKYIGGIESGKQENSTYPSTKGICTKNDLGQLEIESNGNSIIDVAIEFNSILQRIIGKKIYFNIGIDYGGSKAISCQLYFYKIVNGIFNNLINSIFSIVSGEYTTLPIQVPIETNYIRLIVKTATNDILKITNLSFSESYHKESDVKIYDDTSSVLEESKKYTNKEIEKAKDEILAERDTLYDAMAENLNKVIVGGKIYRKIKSGLIPDLNTEINKHDYYYTSTKKLPKKVENLIVVDTKGTLQDYFNRGRVLELVTSDGWMYFRNAYSRYEKIKVEDFLANLIPHDGSGIDANKIEWLDLPSSQTETEKSNKLSEELPKWKMYDDSKSSAFSLVYNKSSVGWISREMANGNIVNQIRTIKKDGTVITPKLNNPIIGNPTHLIIKENGNILYEKPLKDAISSDIKWGEMKANQGSVTYNNNVFAAINWNNGKQITVNGLNLVSGHTYEFILRGRRYGTNCTNGRVDLISSDVFGSIILEDTILRSANNSATLVDNSTTIAINKNMSEITLRAVAPEYIDFTYGNGASTTPNWGFCASENNLLFTEYVSEKRSGLAYLSKDNGESYDVIFDVSLNEMFCNIGGGHIHGGCVDAYWNKIVLVFGDLDFAKGVYHADFNDSTTQDNISWAKEIPENPFYGRNNGEQYCSAFACEDFILFGTDTTPTGIFRMPRINKDKFTRREPSKLICVDVLSHVPSMFYRRNEQSPIFIASMVAGVNHPDREYDTSIYHCTWDGINVEEIYKDNVKCGGFGDNAYMVIFHYNGKVFMTQHGDNRFANNHTLFIGDYKV